MNRSSLTFPVSICSAILWTTLQAQTFSSQFFGIGGNSTINFNPVSGQLTIPGVRVLPGPGNPGGYYYNVRLGLVGDTLFELEDFQDISADKECTVAEVTAAQSQLNFDLSLTELEALVGCDAVLAIIETDLETGRLVSAGFTGADGVPNPSRAGGAVFSSFSISPSPAWIPVDWRPISYLPAPGSPFLAPSGVPYNPFSVSAASPAIEVRFREGTVESYRVFPRSTASICMAPADLPEALAGLNAGLTLDQISSQLLCTPQLVFVESGREETASNYIWRLYSSLSPGYPDIPFPHLRATVSATVVAGQVRELTVNLDATHSEELSCSKADLELAAVEILVGTALEQAVDQVPCVQNTLTRTSTQETESTIYLWRSDLMPPSILESVNRNLSIRAEDGVVEEVELRRI